MSATILCQVLKTRLNDYLKHYYTNYVLSISTSINAVHGSIVLQIKIIRSSSPVPHIPVLSRDPHFIFKKKSPSKVTGALSHLGEVAPWMAFSSLCVKASCAKHTKVNRTQITQLNGVKSSWFMITVERDSLLGEILVLKNPINQTTCLSVIPTEIVK